MKHLSLRWLAAALLGPVLIVVGILLVAGSPRQAAGAGGNGFVQVAFTGTLTTSDGAPISQEYQRVLLNVESVRLNPSGDLTISDFDPSWVTIAAPARVGLSNPSEFISTSLNFGGSLGSAELTAALSVLQLDLVTLQNIPFFFNGASIPAQRYNQVELALNSTSLGSVVPLCPQSAPAGEGCVPYRVRLKSTTNPLRAGFSKPYDVSRGTVQPLVINIAVTVGPGPTSDQATVEITPAITPQGNSHLPPPNSNLIFNPAMGTVMGTVTKFTTRTRVTAEFSGTNQIVARTRLMKDGTFLLSLPAVACGAVVGGKCSNFTPYDFYVSGNGAYVVRSRVPVSSQGAPTALPTLKVPRSTFSSIGGTIYDGCVANSPIPAATLQLLVPDTSVAEGSMACDLTGDPPAIPSNCVAVATAASDDQGHYSFGSLPVSLTGDVPHYDLEISAPGFNTTVQEVEKGEKGGLNCPCAGFKNNLCKFNLEHGYLAGTTSLSSANDSPNELDLLVMAEDSGTDNIENLTLSRIPVGDTTGSFRMAVPDAAPSPPPGSCSLPVTSLPVTNYDVFAAVQDLFSAAPQKISGHSIETAASVGAPEKCATLTVSRLPQTKCVGLGSVFGTVSGANPSTTSVRMSKDDVQIMETEPNSIGVPPSANDYNFCAPSDPYVLTHYESGGPVPSPVSSVAVTLAAPTSVPSPCVSICQKGKPNTCFLCQPAVAPGLP